MLFPESAKASKYLEVKNALADSYTRTEGEEIRRANHDIPEIRQSNWFQLIQLFHCIFPDMLQSWAAKIVFDNGILV